jgi:hypothetical protein
MTKRKVPVEFSTKKLFALNNGSLPHQYYAADSFAVAVQVATDRGVDVSNGLVWYGTLLEGEGERLYRTVIDKDRLSNYPSPSSCFFVKADSYSEAEEVFLGVVGEHELSNMMIISARILE